MKFEKNSAITIEEWMKEEVCALSRFCEHWKKQMELGDNSLYPSELRRGDWDEQCDLFNDAQQKENE